jgi:hypothetical protein
VPEQPRREVTQSEQSVREKEYRQQLDLLTQLAEAENTAEVAKVLDLSEDAVKLSLDCAGGGRRKSNLQVGDEMKKITHFSHMARVAFMVKHFFPKDISGRLLAMLHDTKEEAQEGQKEKYKESLIANQIDLLTEENVTEEEINAVRQNLPEGYDAKYIATYRKYIKRLCDNWDQVGAMELCDRLDGSTSYEYLLNPKYRDRMPHKALESFGRIWATLHGQSNEVADRIKTNSKAWFNRLGITEEQVEQAAGLFLKE